MKLLRSIIISIALISVALWMGAANAAASFTPEQKTEIQSIVHEYLVNNPQVLVEVSQALQRKQQDQAQKQAINTIPAIANDLFLNADSPVVGNPKGKVTIVEFFDYQCPHCKHMSPVLDQILKNNPDVRIVYKELPIFGDESAFAAKAALAAQMQNKYAEMHEALMNFSGRFQIDDILKIAKDVGLDVKKLQTDMQDQAIDSELKNNFKLANQLNVSGTPAFIVAATPDGKIAPTAESLKITYIPGATDIEQLNSAIKKAE